MDRHIEGDKGFNWRAPQAHLHQGPQQCRDSKTTLDDNLRRRHMVTTNKQPRSGSMST
jgi:hypothetical protein